MLKTGQRDIVQRHLDPAPAFSYVDEVVDSRSSVWFENWESPVLVNFPLNDCIADYFNEFFRKGELTQEQEYDGRARIHFLKSCRMMPPWRGSPSSCTCYRKQVPGRRCDKVLYVCLLLLWAAS